MLKTRVLTALVLLGLFLGALFGLPDAGWLVLVALVAALAGWEWGGLIRVCGPSRTGYAVALGGLTLVTGLATGLHAGPVAREVLVGLYGLSAAFWLTVVPCWLLRRWPLQGGRGFMVGLVVLLPAMLALAHLRLLDPWLLLGVMACVWVADIAAYFVGRACGRRKLAPAISPGKSWEGVYGALVAVPLFGLLLVSVSLGLPGFSRGLLLVGLLVGFTLLSVAGDLFESLLKRSAGLKDSGSLLPGHGGMLDRIDSLTSTLPLAMLAVLFW